MSDTPRTDREVWYAYEESGNFDVNSPIVNADFARGLERELTAMTVEHARVLGMLHSSIGDQEGRLQAVTAERDELLVRLDFIKRNVSMVRFDLDTLCHGVLAK